eukprot:629158-Amphidinium_carterae.1
MREQELDWARQWRERLLALLQPYFEVLPAFTAAASRENPDQELHDLFGALRWSTLRQHHRNLQQMLRVKLDLLPLTQNKAHAVLQFLEDQQAAPSKLGTWTTTMRWLHSITGGDMSIATLLKKKAAISDRLADTRLATPKRAKSMSLETVKALEYVCTQSHNWVVRLGAGHFRFLLGSSARFDDGQHTRGDTQHVTPTTIEFAAWQTKTMRVARSRSQVLPLICPLLSIGEQPWWSSYINALGRLNELLPDRDYLLPTPSHAFDSFQAFPC